MDARPYLRSSVVRVTVDAMNGPSHEGPFIVTSNCDAATAPGFRATC